MANPLFLGDPNSGTGVTIYGDGSSFSSDVEQYSFDRFYTSGTSLIDVDNPGVPIPLGRQGPFTLQRFTGGGYNLTSEILRGSVNRSVGRDYSRLISGTLDVTLPNGETRTLNVEPTHVAEAGKQWVAYQQEGGGWGYTQARGPFSNNAQVQAELGATFRLASPTEAIYSALLKRVISDNTEELDRIIDAYDIDKTDLQKAQYDAATLAIKLGSIENIRTFSSYLFD